MSAVVGRESDWRHRAACLSAEPEVFFPVGNPQVSATARLLIAFVKKTYCGSEENPVCEVRKECLKFALDTHQDEGVWGGLTDGERKTLRRRAGRARSNGGRS